QGYQPHGPLEVNLIEGEGLETGVFRVRPATSKRGGMEPEPAPVTPPRVATGTAVDQRPVPPRPAARTNPSSRPWLDIGGDRYPLLGSLTTLGRDDSADIVVDDPGVSRRHSEIRVTTDGPHLITSIRDLNSTNGTFVNGERISSQRLHDGDRITLGRTSATFRAGRR
ncbi:MAG TPA: FHA domain-containing protein, partial [Humibacillus sp.]|nr:FHA domain-containing protein [Humibacillus sp.]